MTSTNGADLTLVLGAHGTTGRRVASRLAERGIATRLGSRSGEPPFDWADERTWPAVLDGVSAAYLVYYPDLVAPEALERVRRFAVLAADERRRPARAAVRTRGEGRRAGRAGRDGRRDGVDDRPVGVLRPELQREGVRGLHPQRDGGAARTRGRRALRGRRRHRRRRGGRVDRGGPRRPGLRGDRPAAAALRRRRRRHRRRRRTSRRVPAGHGRRVRRGAHRGRPARGRGEGLRRDLRDRARRTQRFPERRRAARARPPTPRLHVRRGHRRDGRLARPSRARTDESFR